MPCFTGVEEELCLALLRTMLCFTCAEEEDPEFEGLYDVRLSFADSVRARARTHTSTQHTHTHTHTHTLTLSHTHTDPHTKRED